MISIAALLVACVFCVSLLLLLIPLAAKIGLVDHPGGRKHHAAETPLVGGMAIAVIVTAALLLYDPLITYPLLIAMLVIVGVGIADDIHELPPLAKFLAQAVAALIVIFACAIKLKTVGNLIGTGYIGLWWFASLMSVIAVIGVINALNMADGIDGHAGSIGTIAFLAYAYVARESGMWGEYKLLLVLAGATAGFLLLNARWPWNNRARTFLGDTGSMLIGFFIACFAIQLSAGNGAPTTGTRSFPAICALWVIVLPLCDCVSLMLRRRKAGYSMFVADRQHLHHYLLNRGLSVGQANLVSAIANTTCAAIGIAGWTLGAPEPLMFAAFVALFVGYHLHMKRAFLTMPTHSQMQAS
jgi:UDP-GlcNAc:undecaprenyl-phosphate/decaprenyl-phosphate GlcNAc-1-phosphate transferase